MANLFFIAMALAIGFMNGWIFGYQIGVIDGSKGGK